jgi:hypothetical protein
MQEATVPELTRTVVADTIALADAGQRAARLSAHHRTANGAATHATNGTIRTRAALCQPT